MKKLKGLGGLAILGGLIIAGCGGGGGGVLTPNSPEYRMVTVASGETIGLYTVSSGGAVSELGTMNTAGQFTSVVAVPNRAYMSSANTDGIFRLDFENDLPGNSGAVAVAGDSSTLLYKHPTKAVLYGLVPTQNKIDQYTIEANGNLTVLPQANADLRPVDMVFHPNGNFAYVVSRNSKVVRVYSISAGGELVFIPGAAYPTTINPLKIHISDDGAYLYAMGEDKDISQFSVGGNGLLSPLAPQKVAYPMGNFRSALTANNVLSFYRESDEGVETFGRSGNGQLTNMGAENYATSSITDIYRLPGQNLLLLLAKGSGSSSTIAMGSNGIGSYKSSTTLPVNTVDVDFWEVQ